MSNEETPGGNSTPVNSDNTPQSEKKSQTRESRIPGPRKKRRRPSRTSRIPKPPATAETREVEEQSLGPGRKKRIFKRRKPRDDKEQGPQTTNEAASPGGEQNAGGGPQRNRKKKGRSGQSRNDSNEANSGRARSRNRRDGNGADSAAKQNNPSRRRRGRGDGGQNLRKPSDNRIAAMNVTDNAPDGTFGADDFPSLDTRMNGRAMPAYIQDDSAALVDNEAYFSGRKGHDFASMTDSELDFLKPHEVDENELYEDMPVLDVSRPPRGKLMDIVGVKTHRSGIIEPFDCEDLILDKGDEVVVETDRGLAIGEVMMPTTRRWVTKEVPRVFRVASPNDMRQRDRNLQKAAEAFDLCQKSIVKLKLVMKLVEVMYLHGGNKAVFFFMAEGRVDFRQLVKELARELHIRVEMRQIGVRDASRMIGGLGTCGLTLCCSRYIREFAPVSIRMAKDQDLVLNPEKVSGQCGRLMCCLAYEEEVYKEKGKLMPRVGKMVETPEGCGRVRDRDILRGQVRVELETEHGLRAFDITDIRPIKPNNDGRSKQPQDASDAPSQDAPSTNDTTGDNDGNGGK